MSEAAAAAREVVLRKCVELDLMRVNWTPSQRTDAILAALDADNLTIVERGMVAIPLEDADAVDMIVTDAYLRLGNTRLDALRRPAMEKAYTAMKDAITRAESGSGEGEGNR